MNKGIGLIWDTNKGHLSRIQTRRPAGDEKNRKGTEQLLRKETTMKISQDVVVRQIADKILLIPTGKAALNANGLISLTPSGELLVRKLQEECTPDDLADALMEKYDVGREQAAADVEKFLEKLRTFGLLCE